MNVRLTAEECWDVLATAHTGILTSLRKDGMPITLPVWFVALDRRIYVSGPARTKKFARMANDPRVSFLVESGVQWVKLVGVHLTGTAHVVDDSDLLARVAAAMDEKYLAFRLDRRHMPDATRNHYETQNVTIEISPDERILSWDNARVLQ